MYPFAIVGPDDSPLCVVAWHLIWHGRGFSEGRRNLVAREHLAGFAVDLVDKGIDERRHGQRHLVAIIIHSKRDPKHARADHRSEAQSRWGRATVYSMIAITRCCEERPP